MKKIIFTLLLVGSSAFAQLDIASKWKPLTSTQGFFVNGGKTPVKEFNCYFFDDLILAFDIDDRFFNYDRIRIKVVKGKAESDEDFSGLNTYFYDFSAEQFAQFQGKKYAYLNLFPKPGLNEPSVMDFRRSDLQITNKDNGLSGAYVYVFIFGGNRTGGKHIEYKNDFPYEDYNHSYGELLRFKVPLNNRVKASRPNKLVGEKVPCNY